MIEKLRAHLQHYMDSQNLSAHALEKKAGLKSCVVSNLVSGRSKNPTFETIVNIATALGCSIPDLLGEPKRSDFVIRRESENDAGIDIQLFEKVVCSVTSKLTEHKVNILIDTVFSLIQEAYIYSSKTTNKEVDSQFIDWIVDKVR